MTKSDIWVARGLFTPLLLVLSVDFYDAMHVEYARGHIVAAAIALLPLVLLFPAILIGLWSNLWRKLQ